MDGSSPLFWYKLLFVTELLIAEGLITYTISKKDRFPLRVLVSAPILYAAAFFFPIPEYSAAYTCFLFFSLFALTVVALKFCYDESWINVLFCAIIAYTAQHIAYEMHNLVTLALDLDTINVYLPDQHFNPGEGIFILNLALYVLCFALVYWFIWAFIAIRIRRQRELVFSNFYLFFWVVITIVIDVVFSAIMSFNMDNSSRPVIMMFTTSNIFACCLSLGYQYLMLEKDNTTRELRTIQMLWKKDKERYELSKENIELLNIRVHDLKSQISALRNLGGLIDENTLIELENTLSYYGVNIQTGNDALDVIMAEKHILCEKKGIRLICMMDGSGLSGISPGKLYSLFGNALQNAIESTEQIEDPAKRLIIANVKTQGGMVFAHVENSCPENASLNLVDGLPQTTKQDKKEHGYGLRSMKLLCQSLGGNLDFAVKDDRFLLDIVLPAAGSH